MIEEFVDGPLVVGVPSVFKRGDPPVSSDQEICWQPKAAAGGPDRSKCAALGAVVCEPGGLAGDRRARADPAELALTVMSALQGGLLMAQATRSARPLELALHMALPHTAGYRRRPKQAGRR
jgi:hypothetical protein